MLQTQEKDKPETDRQYLGNRMLYKIIFEENIMIKHIAIVSLSSGTIGEDFVK